MERTRSLATSLSLTFDRRLALMAAGIAAAALATALSTHLRIPLPFTPVPITAQTMVVLLSGAILGAAGGAISQIVFLALGTAGVTTFAGGSLAGVTGGYLVGFVCAAAIVGSTARRTSSVILVGGAMLLSTLVILGIGATWLALIGNLSASEAFAAGVLPFLPGDLMKAAGALGVWSAGRAVWRRLFADGADHE